MATGMRRQADLQRKELHSRLVRRSGDPAIRRSGEESTDVRSVNGVARLKWPDDIEEEVDDSQGREQDLLSGRCGTRTHDLSRVKAAL
jgi:hypothetical protein